MQKVEGSNPFSRSKRPTFAGLFRFEESGIAENRVSIAMLRHAGSVSGLGPGVLIEFELVVTT
jgi:hypothetical protein